MNHDYNDNDENEKQNWRDIDRKKDKSKHVSEDVQEDAYKSTRKDWMQKMYMKEIDNLFKGKKSSKEHAEALNEIHERAGTRKFNTVVKKYVKEYGLPDDWSTLFLLLDYKEIRVVKKTVLALVELSKEETLTRKEGLRSKLNIMSMTAKEESLKDFLEEVLEDF